MMQHYRVPSSIASRFPEGTTLVGLDEVRKLYAALAKEHEEGVLLKSAAGHETLRWARRVLRQDGSLRSLLKGDAQVPEIIDLRFGPDVLVGAVQKSMREVLFSLDGECCAVPCGESTAIFLPVDVDMLKADRVRIGDEEYPCERVELPWDLEFKKATFLTESTSKLRTLAKSARSSVGCSAYVLHGDVLGYEDPLLLRFSDLPRNDFEMLKVDEKLGIVMGWGIICKVNGADYIDLQEEHIPEDVMFRGAVDFMRQSQMMGEMHERVEKSVEGRLVKQPVWKGHVVFAWPMTTEVAKAYGITTSTTGLMVAVHPDDPEVLEKFRTGEYTGFSIGGGKIVEEA